MNIRPLYDRIVVKRIDEKETTGHGIIIPDSAQEKPLEGGVIAAGHGKRLENGTIVASMSKRATVSCSENIPGPRLKWPAPITSSCAKTMCSVSYPLAESNR
jgi:co-chaperonin GroES (HSP10)